MDNWWSLIIDLFQFHFTPRRLPTLIWCCNKTLLAFLCWHDDHDRIVRVSVLNKIRNCNCFYNESETLIGLADSESYFPLFLLRSRKHFAKSWMIAGHCWLIKHWENVILFSIVEQTRQIGPGWPILLAFWQRVLGSGAHSTTALPRNIKPPQVTMCDHVEAWFLSRQ